MRRATVVYKEPVRASLPTCVRPYVARPIADQTTAEGSYIAEAVIGWTMTTQTTAKKHFTPPILRLLLILPQISRWQEISSQLVRPFAQEFSWDSSYFTASNYHNLILDTLLYF